jgi:hypothetical protein
MSTVGRIENNNAREEQPTEKQMRIKSPSHQADRKGNTPRIEFKMIFIFVFFKKAVDIAGKLKGF